MTNKLVKPRDLSKVVLTIPFQWPWVTCIDHVYHCIPVNYYVFFVTTFIAPTWWVPLSCRIHPLEVVLLPADATSWRLLLGESSVLDCVRPTPSLQSHHQEVCLWGRLHICEGRVWSQGEGQGRQHHGYNGSGHWWDAGGPGTDWWNSFATCRVSSVCKKKPGISRPPFSLFIFLCLHWNNVVLWSKNNFGALLMQNAWDWSDTWTII